MWTVINLIYRKEDNIVIKVGAKYELTTSGITTSNNIWVNLQEPTSVIIPFNNLTEQDALSWVFNGYDTNTVEIKVQDEHNKTLYSPHRDRLPWLN
jgi:hypothetical protein